MTKYKRISSITVFTLLLSFSALAGNETTNVRVSFFMGNNSIIRNGKTMIVQVNSVIKDGDIINVRKYGFVNLLVNKKVILKIKGPNTFRFNGNDIENGIETGRQFSKISRLFDKDSKYKLPRTIVAGVRSANQKRENRKLRYQLNEAIELIKKGKYDSSWKKLTAIEKNSVVRTSAKLYIQFYKAEILFKKNQFPQAFHIYRKLNSKSFAMKEETYIKAIMSAELSGMKNESGNVMKEYESLYKGKGYYSKFIKKIK